MSLSAERMAMADRAIQRTFERASVAWQAVPHWDTGDPGQVKVRNDVTFSLTNETVPPVPQPDAAPFDSNPIKLTARSVDFRVTLAQASASTPDALLAAVMARTADLARQFDGDVLTALRAQAVPKSSWYLQLPAPGSDPPTIVKALVEGRQLVEDSGYRAPSCLIASTAHFTDLSQWLHIKVATEALLAGGNVTSLHRSSQLDSVTVGDKEDLRLMLMLGRAQEIEHGCAGAASPGEEPVDLAISVPPSLEVIGETAGGTIELAVRIRFATRVKDGRGVVVFHS